MSDIDWSEAPDGAEVYSDKSVQWNKQSVYSTARPAAYDGTTLPPVGTVCEYRPILDDDWITVKITGYGERLALIKPHGKDYETICSKSSATFRPIKTERERVIDEISAAYFEGARGHMGGIAGIYEAGFRKVQS